MGAMFIQTPNGAERVGGGGGGVDVTATVGQTIVVKEVDANGKPTKWEAADYQPRTHWSEMKELLPPTTLVPNEEVGAFAAESNFEFVEGNTYTVTWNGTPYTCVARYILELGGVVVGNVDPLLGTGDSGEPFFVGGTNGMLIAAPFDGSTEIVVSVSGEATHKLDKRFLPDGVVLGIERYTGGAFDFDKWMFEKAGISLSGNTEGFVDTPITKEQFETLKKELQTQLVYIRAYRSIAAVFPQGNDLIFNWREIDVTDFSLYVTTKAATMRWSDEHGCMQYSCTQTERKVTLDPIE